MRWMVRIGLALLVGWVVFAVSPYVALYNLARAVEARDVAAIRERVNFRAVRLSITKQIVTDYLVSIGKGRELSASDRSLAAGVGATIADPLVAKLVTPEALLDLLDDGWPEGVVPGKPPGSGGLGVNALKDAWRVFAASETRGFRVVRVPLPPEKPPEEQFRLQLRFQHLAWRLTGVELPAALRQRLVKELPSGAA